ncbi:MAG TPA: LuxR C-terminal-related transcriptional regulator [Prolixibacteraceae bacterium]|nr:LuxR C-terminal-related transcriptional regulator [Prolixibacteraceae bacterium]
MSQTNEINRQIGQLFKKEELDYSVLNNHIQFLESLSVLQSSVVSIFDLAEMTHVYLSPNFSDLLGWDPEKIASPDNDYINQRMHPDDLAHLNQVSWQFFELILKVDPVWRNQMKYIKLIMDYRTQGREGNYVRVIEQHKLLELDSYGNAWLSMSIMDLSPDQDLTSLCRYRLINTLTGELYRFPSSELMAEHKLSFREQEILHLLAKGLISKQIADKLFISVNTVNTHRQRIIEKLSVSNTAEAVQYAGRLGLI